MLSAWPALLGLAAAADPPSVNKTAREQSPTAMRRQETKAELHRLTQEARQLERARKLPEAIAAGEEATRLARELEGDASETVAVWQERLAQLHEVREEWQPASQARQDVLATRTKLYGEKDWRVTDARLALEQTLRLSQLDVAQRRELARVTACNQEIGRRYQKGQIGNAIQLAETVLAIRKQALGEADPQYAESLNNLAFLYQSRGDDAKAEPLYLQALAIRKKVLGEAHPDYAESLNNLAALYQSRRDFTKAELLYRQASEIWKHVLGEAHPDYATSLNNLAVLYKSQGDYAKAEPLYRQALAIRKKVQGEMHPDYAMDLNNLAELYRSQGDYAKAEPLCRKVLAIRKQTLGEAHPDYATSLNNLAELYRSQGDYVKAEPLCREALAIRKQTLGDAHPDYAGSLNNLALLLQATNRLAEAEPLMRRSVIILHQFGRATGHEPAGMQTVLKNYRELLTAMRLDQAEITERLKAATF
ncbi:MAG TPA: tetratricopeptide repeat protein [Planctomycetaceae bacterium]|nr:tetratricopeptide repeat protein [Planctomycetaceae bacterium]